MSDLDFITPEQIAQNEFYQDFLTPHRAACQSSSLGSAALAAR